MSANATEPSWSFYYASEPRLNASVRSGLVQNAAEYPMLSCQ